MTNIRRLVRPLVLALPLAVAIACPDEVYAQLAPAQPGSDPFAAGLRWGDASSAAAPWIPRDLALAADGELVWAAPSVTNPHVALYGSGELGEGAPLALDAAFAGLVGELRVAAGDDPSELFSVAQHAAPDAAHRATFVRRHDLASAAVGGPFEPLWSHSLDLVVHGNALVACDAAGEVLVAAAFDKASASVRLDRVDPSSGALVARVDLAGQGLQHLSVAADGGRIALAAGLDLWVLDAAGAVVHHEALAATTHAVALSGDGARLAVGGFGAVRVLADAGAGYALAQTVQRTASEIATRAALSRDGSTLAIGWWNFVTGVAVRLDALELGGGEEWLSVVKASSGATNLQDFPVALDLSDDGSRVAFGLWGVGDGQPEVLLYARGESAPLLAADTGGSVLDLELDRAGRRLAVATKGAHANQFATTGAVLLFDTGERDLQVVGSPFPGAAFELAFRSEGLVAALFLIGSPAAAPLALPGVAGALALDPAAPLALLAPTALGANRADLELAVPAGPAFVGLDLRAQAVALDAGGLFFSDDVVRPALP